MTSEGIRLHLGCGLSPLEGWTNLDSIPNPGVDVVCDLDAPGLTLPFGDSSVSAIIGFHVLEHIHNILPLMSELYRVAMPGTKAVFRTPYGSSDDADEDPTHVRRFFPNSWGYFSQPFYWRANYGYLGDWDVEEVLLKVPRSRFEGVANDEIFSEIQGLRNVVLEMQATLCAVKPARAPDRSLQRVLNLRVQRVPARDNEAEL